MMRCIATARRFCKASAWWLGREALGKTQTAIEYVHRFGGVYQGGVYWVAADCGVRTLISQVSEAAGIEVDKKAPAMNYRASMKWMWHRRFT
jgi:hypothetical protein